MKTWMAVLLFCGALPACCQPASEFDFDRVLGPPAAAPEYVPMSFTERSRHYLVAAFGPGAVVCAAAAGGFEQATVEPREWRVGATAYGDRVGSAFAQQVIRETSNFGERPLSARTIVTSGRRRPDS